MIAGVLVATILVALLLAGLLAVIRNDGYGQRPPPPRLDADFLA